ncbi:hypothetical protein Ac2012v2_006201 [Leucoagaricus gongylophorus]
MSALTPFIHLQATRYTQVVAISLFAWDYLLTFDKEVLDNTMLAIYHLTLIQLKYYWRTNWSWQKLLFFANRYLTLTSLVINTTGLVSSMVADKVNNIYLHSDLSKKRVSFVSCLSCFFSTESDSEYMPGFDFVHYLITYIGAVDIFLVQGILSSRVYAIYKRPRMLKYCLVALFTCCSTISIALIALSMRDVPVTSHPLAGLIACSTLRNPVNIWAFWIPILVYEGVIFVLASRGAIKHLVASPFNGSLSHSIMNIILRDSVVYFFIVFVAYVVNAVIWRYAPPTLLDIIHGPTLALVSSLATRMMFNLKDQGVLETSRRDDTPIKLGSVHAESAVRRFR